MLWNRCLRKPIRRVACWAAWARWVACREPVVQWVVAVVVLVVAVLALMVQREERLRQTLDLVAQRRAGQRAVAGQRTGLFRSSKVWPRAMVCSRSRMLVLWNRSLWSRLFRLVDACCSVVLLDFRYRWIWKFLRSIDR